MHVEIKKQLVVILGGKCVPLPAEPSSNISKHQILCACFKCADSSLFKDENYTGTLQVKILGE